MRQALVEKCCTSIGFDVHARSVVGCGLDRSTGEVFERRLTPDHRKLLERIRSLPAPAVATYGADGIRVGPGIGVGGDRLPGGRAVEVAAPSRASGQDRCPRCPASGPVPALGEIVAVTVPSVEQEAARDLVRAREDCRGDLIAAPHGCRNCSYAKGSSILGRRRGHVSMSGGCARTGSTPAGCSWPMTAPSTPRWPPIRRSPRW
jgi:hypothetical protein